MVRARTWLASAIAGTLAAGIATATLVAVGRPAGAEVVAPFGNGERGYAIDSFEPFIDITHREARRLVVSRGHLAEFDRFHIPGNVDDGLPDNFDEAERGYPVGNLDDEDRGYLPGNFEDLHGLVNLEDPERGHVPGYFGNADRGHVPGNPLICASDLCFRGGSGCVTHGGGDCADAGDGLPDDVEDTHGSALICVSGVCFNDPNAAPPARPAAYPTDTCLDVDICPGSHRGPAPARTAASG